MKRISKRDKLSSATTQVARAVPTSGNPPAQARRKARAATLRAGQALQVMRRLEQLSFEYRGDLSIGDVLKRTFAAI
jgi:hypothetical protein